jgi:hypothetical protein
VVTTRSACAVVTGGDAGVAPALIVICKVMVPSKREPLSSSPRMCPDLTPWVGYTGGGGRRVKPTFATEDFLGKSSREN